MNPHRQIKVKEIGIKMEISQSTASRKLQLVRDALDKRFPKIITVKEFCDYYEIPEWE